MFSSMYGREIMCDPSIPIGRKTMFGTKFVCHSLDDEH